MVWTLRLSALLAASSLLSGCLFEPMSLRLQRVRLQIESLEERIARLEGPEGFGMSVVSAPAGAFTEVGRPVVLGRPVSGQTSGTTTPLGDIAEIGEVAAPVVAAARVGRPLVETADSFWLPAVPFDGRKALTKLVRGLTNVVTGWIEVPKRVHAAY